MFSILDEIFIITRQFDFPSPSFVISFFETWSCCIALAGLELTSVFLPQPGITGVSYHIWLNLVPFSPWHMYVEVRTVLILANNLGVQRAHYLSYISVAVVEYSDSLREKGLFSHSVRWHSEESMASGTWGRWLHGIRMRCREWMLA